MSRPMTMVVALLACLLGPSLCQALEAPTLRLSDAFRSLRPSDGVPAAWAGIWEDSDSVYVGCGEEEFLLQTSTDQDTVCTGESAEPDTTGVGNLNCEGTITDTSIELTCTGSVTTDGCTASFTFHITGTRSGDTAVAVLTSRVQFSPPEACENQPDYCTRIVTRSIRIGPEPPGCSTPVRAVTWGHLKTLYR